jgi:hypothetical protein
MNLGMVQVGRSTASLNQARYSPGSSGESNTAALRFGGDIMVQLEQKQNLGTVQLGLKLMI